MGEKTGFFKIDRRLLEEALWLSEPFTKAQAWVDLIGRASYADTEGCKRGQIITTERALADRWKWTRKKVQCFLRALEASEMVKIDRLQGTRLGTSQGTSQGTRITLENYGKYQGQGTSLGTREGTSLGTYKKNIKNIKNNISIMPDGIREELVQIFGDRTDQLIEDVRTYYEGHPEKEFPGWRQAVLQFNSNQQRWARPKKAADPMARAIAAFMEEET